MRKLLLVAAMMVGACSAAEPGDGLPSKMPVTATEVIVCSFGKQQILTIVVTYPDGSVVRFKTDAMHGMTVEQLLAYAGQAHDTYTIGQTCGTET